MMPIVDLHSDLLSFLAEKQGRSFEDPTSRSSYPQLKAGGVRLQTLAIFAATEPGSVQKGRLQVEHFLHLLRHPTHFAPFSPSFAPALIQLLPAFENASSFVEEEEPLAEGLKRLEEYKRALGPIAYIGLTWNGENRFGGGNNTLVGLKSDGKRLLDALHGARIAVDLSHTSDPLAYDIVEWIDARGLEIPVIASHSNYRALSPYKRNLPDDLAQEIIRRKGLIGLNFFAPFIHDTDPSVLARHVEYALHLGGEEALCFGADFFDDIGNYNTELKAKYGREEFFYKEFQNASVYPSVLEWFSNTLSLKPGLLERIAYENALAFFKKLLHLYNITH